MLFLGFFHAKTRNKTSLALLRWQVSNDRRYLFSGFSLQGSTDRPALVLLDPEGPFGLGFLFQTTKG